ncbi:MAG TPA: SAM-dependent methyltransferase [Bacteroidia bacterium]|nr:SAM-dependent methyltransferase [Bacteroidia bacterium]
MTEKKGNLFLLPVTLDDATEPSSVLAGDALKAAHELKLFLAENEKSARHFLKKAGTKWPLPEIKLFSMGKHGDESDIDLFIREIENGNDGGIISEAGCPAIADPGSVAVKKAHEKNIRVVPLTGPSSILLALMSSGFSGQRFRFHGYLPIDKNEKARALKSIERAVAEKDETQIFIETPFRNNQLMDDLLRVLDASTMLCVACDLTSAREFVRTKRVSEWKKQKPDLHKRPAVFLVGK